ncbi:transglycosylase family protein [Streptomyces sp. NPDC050738]|uniref:transglycosylase family protein n=1 Tax=Streptomyces sp. NPDC050738 TaxID=3154744 RepID=UPI003431B60C
MSSGNGRHRRPRQAPAFVVAAGVTGSAIAIPLLAATGAHAADSSTWDRVALCESGGMWSADLGNGYYGGLQFSQEKWDTYGGSQYAARADLASRAQQIAVAQKVLDAEGTKPWASCAEISGLANAAEAGATPSVDPGATNTATPAPTDSATPAPSDTETSTPSATPSQSAKPDATATPAPSASADADKGADQGKGQGQGKHRGGTDASDTSDTSGTGRDTGRHASRGDATDRSEAAAGDYTVRTGDNLWAIADAHDIKGGWPALYAANEKTVGSDPDLIVPGQSLDLG